MSRNMLSDALRKYTGLRHQLDQNLLGEKGDEWEEELKKFLRKKPCWVEKLSIPAKIVCSLTSVEQIAAEILGSNKVVGYLDVMDAWGVIDKPEAEPIVNFSEATLKQCAEENKRGVADWRLVYVNGFSLRKQEEIRGRNRKNQPCFDPDYTWWLESQQDSWATKSIEAGYRLLNFKKNFSNMTWQTQNDEIAKLGERFEKAEEQAVTEASFSIFMIKKERLLKDWYHRGRFQSSSDGHVRVGGFVERGFRVYNYCYDDCFSTVGVVLSRKSKRKLEDLKT